MTDSSYDLVVVGGGPAGALAAATAARHGLRVLVLERERFPREKVCGDCLNPSCWPVLERLGIAESVRALPHGQLDAVEFIGLDGTSLRLDLPAGPAAEIAIKRSLFDQALLDRARQLGAEVSEQTTVTRLERRTPRGWNVHTSTGEFLHAQFLIAADGRNSSVAKLLNLSQRPQKERVALQTHLPLPADFGRRIVLQLLPGGYSGQAPVGQDLNLCLVSAAGGIDSLKEWAHHRFGVSLDHAWRSVTPLSRDPVPPAHHGLFLAGDAARIVEPFTGEGIYYAMATGEIAAESVARILGGEDEALVTRQFVARYDALYRGRLWINRLARAAVLSPRIGSVALKLGRIQPRLLQFLTRKVVRTK